MLLIDPDGMFNGDRLARCSDQARLLWPHLYLASNSYGRLELNFRRLRSRIFSGFEHPPTDEQLRGAFAEYGRNFLMFFFEGDGQLWGAWDTPERCLPRYKTAVDRRAPAPDESEIGAWKLALIHKDLRAISENFRKFEAFFCRAVAVPDAKHSEGKNSSGGGGSAGGGSKTVESVEKKSQNLPNKVGSQEQDQEQDQPQNQLAKRAVALIMAQKKLQHRRRCVAAVRADPAPVGDLLAEVGGKFIA